jgi:hypothetical protein
LTSRLVYIAGPYTGGGLSQAQNVRSAIDYGMTARDCFPWVVPVIPHLNHLIDFVTPRSYDYWLEMDMALLARCDALVRMPGVSPGADAEIKFCEENSIPVFYCVADMAKHFNGEDF